MLTSRPATWTYGSSRFQIRWLPPREASTFFHLPWPVLCGMSKSLEITSVRLYGNKKPAPGTIPRGSLEILRRGQLIYARTGGAFEIGRLNPDTNHFVGVGQDITGNGIPDLVISEYTGEELNWYYIFELGETPHLLDVIDDWYGGARFEDLDGDANMEIIISDWSFYNWLKLMTMLSPCRRVILGYNGNSYRPAIDLMRQAAPNMQQLVALVREAQTETSWNWGLPPLPIWQEIQNLIYSGHADLAWRFYEELIWPPDIPRSEQFMTDFIETMVYSPYWPEIQAMNAGKWSHWPQHLFPPTPVAPTQSIFLLPSRGPNRPAPAGAMDAKHRVRQEVGNCLNPFLFKELMLIWAWVKPCSF